MKCHEVEEMDDGAPPTPDDEIDSGRRLGWSVECEIATDGKYMCFTSCGWAQPWFSWSLG